MSRWVSRPSDLASDKLLRFLDGLVGVRFYHRTFGDSATRIVREGFRDATDRYMATENHSGVWVSDVPFDINEAAAGDTLLVLDLDESVVLPFERAEAERDTENF